MRFAYDRAGVTQGVLNQEKSRESPSTFATESGAENISQVSNLDKPKQRMAGEMGHRMAEYLNNPLEQARTDAWMDLFSQSNEGAAFNQAKMGIMPGMGQ